MNYVSKLEKSFYDLSLALLFVVTFLTLLLSFYAIWSVSNHNKALAFKAAYPGLSKLENNTNQSSIDNMGRNQSAR